MARSGFASQEVCSRDQTLLEDYGLTPVYLLNALHVQLPDAFVHHPEEYPSVIYWAFINKLSRDIGMDLTPYLGRDVEVNTYKRQKQGRAVVVAYQGEVIGAWRNDGGNPHLYNMCSMWGRSIKSVTGTSIAEWLKTVIDPEDPLEKELSRLSPKEVILAHYDALDRGDQKMAMACRTRTSLISYLTSQQNVGSRYLYGPGFEKSDVTSARVISLEPYELEQKLDHYPDPQKMIEANVDIEVIRPRPDGNPAGGTKFVPLVKGTKTTGWRIAQIFHMPCW